MKIAILGHSQVKYLNFRTADLRIKKFYKSGATFVSIRDTNQFQELVQYKPDLIFLLLGSNHITEYANISKIVENYINLKEEINLKIEPAQGIFLLDIEKRTKNNRYVNYNTYRKVRNSLIKKIRKFDKPNFIPYKPVSGLLDSNIGPDGVHVNPEGAKKITETIEEKVGEILRA